MMAGLIRLPVLGEDSSHYKAEFRNSRSWARFRSLCRADKQRQCLDIPVLRSKATDPCFLWGFHIPKQAELTQLDLTSYQWGVGAQGTCQVMATLEISYHYSMRHFLSGSLRRLHWVVIVQLTACPGRNSQEQQMLLSGGWGNFHCTHSKSWALGSIFFSLCIHSSLCSITEPWIWVLSSHKRWLNQSISVFSIKKYWIFKYCK